VIVDTSALFAIMAHQPERAEYLAAIQAAPSVQISAASYVELGVVIDARRDPLDTNALDDLLRALRVEVAPVTAEQATVARAAYRDFGRGSGHPARLNFGDCFSYALARVSGEPLLFKGDDFVHTDVLPAVGA
jgi:ribonuclease VapC